MVHGRSNWFLTLLNCCRKVNEEQHGNSESQFSWRKHFSQYLTYFSGAVFVNFAQAFYQTTFVYCPDLVQHDLSLLTLESQIDTGGIVSPLCGHRSGDDRSNVTIHLVWRDDKARASFFNLMPNGWIKINQVYFKA